MLTRGREPEIGCGPRNVRMFARCFSWLAVWIVGRDRFLFRPKPSEFLARRGNGEMTGGKLQTAGGGVQTLVDNLRVVSEPAL